MTKGQSSLRGIPLAGILLLPLACARFAESISLAAQTQLYHLVLSTSLQHAEVHGAVPQIGLRTVRVTPDGVPYPGDNPDHYSSEDSPALRNAADALAGVTLRESSADFEMTPPAEIFVLSNPTLLGDSTATVGIRVARLAADGYWSDAWEARLRWKKGQWILREWVRLLHEEGH